MFVRDRFGVRGIVLLSLSAPACATAHAQSAPDAGSAATAQSDAGAAAAIDSAPPATAYSGPRPYVFLRPPRVGAGITADQVQRLFRRNLASVEVCYTNQLARNATARGLANVRVTVIAGGMGSVDSARVSPSNAEFDSCLRDAVGRWEWPNPRNQPSVSVTLQVELAPTPPENAGRR